MSRIGRLPIAVPSGVDVDIDGQLVTVKGPKGTLTHSVAEPITVERADDGTVQVARPDDERASRSLHGLSRTLIANMVVGVTDGYTKTLEIVGTGYRVQAKGADLEFALGYSHPVLVTAPDGISFRVETPTRFAVQGIDKQQVGEISAKIRNQRQTDPYKGKGVRYQGEVVRRKAGKAGKKYWLHRAFSRRPAGRPASRKRAGSPVLAGTSGCARRSPAPPSVLVWSSTGRPGICSCRSSTTHPAVRWPRCRRSR